MVHSVPFLSHSDGIQVCIIDIVNAYSDANYNMKMMILSQSMHDDPAFAVRDLYFLVPHGRSTSTGYNQAV